MRAFARTIVVIVLGTLAVLPSRAAGGTVEERFDAGYAAYEAGRWDEAVEAFREAADAGVRDPRVEYNLGNSEFRRGRLGPAILHWERALRLAPGDPDVEANLELARERLVDRVETPPAGGVGEALRRFQDGLGPDLQALLVMALSWGCAAIVAAGLRRPRGFRPGWAWTLAVLAVLAALVAWSLSASLERIEGGNGAIVMDASLQVLAGPSEANATVFRIHEGTRVEIRETRGDWLQVILPNGLTGWVPRDALEAI